MTAKWNGTQRKRILVEASMALPNIEKIKLGDEEFDVEKKEDLVVDGLPDPSTPITLKDEP